jgi:hypothetical protein
MLPIADRVAGRKLSKAWLQETAARWRHRSTGAAKPSPTRPSPGPLAHLALEAHWCDLAGPCPINSLGVGGGCGCHHRSRCRLHELAAAHVKAGEVCHGWLQAPHEHCGPELRPTHVGKDIQAGLQELVQQAD